MSILVRYHGLLSQLDIIQYFIHIFCYNFILYRPTLIKLFRFESLQRLCKFCKLLQLLKSNQFLDLFWNFDPICGNSWLFQYSRKWEPSWMTARRRFNHCATITLFENRGEIVYFIPLQFKHDISKFPTSYFNIIAKS